MANAANPLIPKDGTLTITDGGALSLTVAYEDGDFNISGLNAQDQQTYQSFRDRGKTYAVRAVEDQDIDFGFTCHATHIIGDGTTGTIGDAALRKGAWSSYTSKLPAANGDAYLVQVSWTGSRTPFGASANNVITLKYAAIVMDFSEGVPGKITIKGTGFCLSTDYLTIT